MSNTSSEDAVHAVVPSAGDFGTVYNRMLALADDHLTRPISVTVNAWEDGTYRIRIFHKVPGRDEHEVLYYHTERSDGNVLWAIETEDEIKKQRVVADIE